MSETLKNIDKDLIDLEERLLGELRRLRKLDSSETYSAIDKELHEELKHVYTALLQSLEHTGDWSNLSLKSDEQEWIEDRMRVVRNLLVRKLPTAFLKASHQEHKEIHTSEFGTDDHYASKELAILDEQVALHHVEGQSIDEVMQGRAQFNARELSKAHAQELAGKGKIAQSPDEIRRKLEGASGARGPSTFTSRDLGGSSPQPPPAKPAAPSPEKRDIAQSPEEIRRKLAARQGGSAGRASFGAKDIQSEADRAPTPKPRAEKPPPAPQPKGKAVFGSKDIEPIREKVQKKEEEKPKGPARFEAKDLSDPKP